MLMLYVRFVCIFGTLLSFWCALDEELVLNLEAFPKVNFRDGDIVEIRALEEQAK